jgi:hypothetical protein
MLHALIDVPGHRPGTMYFAILLAALALPPAKTPKRTYRPLAWRLCGGFLAVVGLLWGIAGLTGLPLHSSTAVASYEAAAREELSAGKYASAQRQVDRWIGLEPLDWRAYFTRARLTLADSGARDAAAEDFRRARFVEPNMGVVALEEGFAWLPYDTDRALAAWREVLSRDVENPESIFRRMLEATVERPELMEGLGLLAQFDPDYRTYFLNYQSGDSLMRELGRDLEADPRLGQFSRRQRTSIVTNWIDRGDKAAAENFLKENEPNLERPWWLWSLLRKEQARFADAVDRIRSAVPAPSLPEVAVEGVPYERLKREFSLAPGDVIKGTALLRFYLERENFQQVQAVAQAMIAARKDAPAYVRFWQAESFFHLQNYIDSWFAYEQYLQQLWGEE